MKGLNVTNYTTMDYITILMRDYLFFCLYIDTMKDRYEDRKIDRKLDIKIDIKIER